MAELEKQSVVIAHKLCLNPIPSSFFPGVFGLRGEVPISKSITTFHVEVQVCLFNTLKKGTRCIFKGIFNVTSIDMETQRNQILPPPRPYNNEAFLTPHN